MIATSNNSVLRELRTMLHDLTITQVYHLEEVTVNPLMSRSDILFIDVEDVANSEMLIDSLKPFEKSRIMFLVPQEEETDFPSEAFTRNMSILSKPVNQDLLEARMRIFLKAINQSINTST